VKISAIMSSKFVDKIDPYHKATLKKQKKSDGSSRYRNKDVVELQTLPLIKGLHCLMCTESGFVYIMLV